MTAHGGRIGAQIIREVAGDLRRPQGRSILALLGIAIGTATVIAMLHVGHSARVAALHQFETLGTDLVMISPTSFDQSVPNISIESVLGLPGQNIGIRDAAAIIRTNVTIHAGRSDIAVTVLAATEALPAIGKLRLDTGRFTSAIDRAAPFVVVGAGVASEIAAAQGSPVAIGSKIRMNDQVLTVIGLLADTPTNVVLSLDYSRSVLIPFAAARRLIGLPSITNVAARLSPGADDQRTATAVTEYFSARMAAGSVAINTARQIIASIDEQIRIYALLIVGIGTVSMLIGGVGIMNVMVMSVMERRQEIGLRQALGAKRRDIRLMFLSEALLLALIGSTIGTAGGYLAGWIFSRSSGWPFVSAPLALPLGAGMALVVGLFFGIYPASRAAHLDPVVALRSE